jgi:hypothetical protein
MSERDMEVPGKNKIVRVRFNKTLISATIFEVKNVEIFPCPRHENKSAVAV